MKKIALSCESTVDLPEELIKQYDLHVVPFTVILGNEEKYDGVITPKQIIEYVNQTNILPKTSAVNQYQYEEHFAKLLNEYDSVIHITLSSEISSAFNNALAVSKRMKNVYVFDSRSLSTGIALQLIYARKLIDKGLAELDILDELAKRRKSVQASFVLCRLDYLYKGGRCNALSYLSATLLKIRPQIIVTNGKMQPKKKYMGKYDKCIVKYVDDTLNEFNTPDLSEVFITSTTATKEQIEAVREKLIARGFKNIHVTFAGATITSHCGENTLGILYINDGNENGEYIKK